MKRIFFISLCLLFIIDAGANNVQLTNISVTNNVTNTGKIIQFNLTWENSWRTASTNNWDGVWVFFKFKDNDGKWYPLRFTGTNITMPAGSTYDIGNSSPAAQGVGMFIYRSANGFGTATATAIKAGITSYPGTFEVRGFAIEMVYIPQGSFSVGDGFSDDALRNSNVGSTPFLITGNGGTVNAGTANGNLYDPEYQGATGFLTGFPVAMQHFG